MKKLVILFVVLVAVGCSDSGNEPVPNSVFNFSAGYTFEFMNSTTGQYEENETATYLKIDSVTLVLGVNQIPFTSDSNMIEYCGVYKGTSSGMKFNGLCDMDTVKVYVDMELHGSDFYGTFKRVYPNGIMSSKKFYAWYRS